MILQDAAAILRANQAVIGLVADRVDYVDAPQATPYPRLVLSVQGTDSYPTIDGLTAMQRHELQVDAWGKSYTDADNVAAAARAALEAAGYVCLSRLSDEFSAEPGTDPGVFRVGFSYAVWIDP